MKIPSWKNKACMVLRTAGLAVVLLIAATAVRPAHGASTSTDGAAARPSPVQNTLTADLAGSRNPDGVMLTIGWFRKWIQEIDEHGLPSRYVQAGANMGVSPAYAKGAVYAEWGPVVFATVRLEYDLYSFFGTNSGLLSFPDARSKFGWHELKNLEGEEETGTGQRILVQPTLYAMAGPVIVMNQTDLTYYRFNGRGPYFLDWEYEMLIQDGDSAFANRTQFLIPAWKGEGQAVLYTGPYYEITHARDADLTRQRIGWFEYWVPADRLLCMNRPRIYSMAAFNIQDRNRQGEIYLAMGVGTDFDLN
ncbi:MAG TPA: hypothetical protein PK600_01655 [Deltaproteobacteria bacterium]|nr:hypothetical protein [Deltaproteobacteria bacterium]